MSPDMRCNICRSFALVSVHWAETGMTAMERRHRYVGLSFIDIASALLRPKGRLFRALWPRAGLADFGFDAIFSSQKRDMS